MIFFFFIYRYVFGYEAMRRMVNFNVLIVGMKGLGVEVVKNVVFGGVKSVIIQDIENVGWGDFSLQVCDVYVYQFFNFYIKLWFRRFGRL